ncbi:MAG: phosphomannomutase/phosphoglucomutase [archaeon]
MIYRQYDIRGVVGKDLTTEIAELIGKAFGTYIKGSVVVGRDNRSSSRSLRDALVRGLLSAGCDVLDVGTVPTPVLYFSIIHYKKVGGVMITGSHNPKGYNGFKLCKGTSTIYGYEILKIKRIVDSRKFRKGRGKVTYANPKNAYVSMIKGKIKVSKKLKIVIDCGNGTGSFIAPKLFKSLGCNVVPLYCTSNSNFPHHLPDPAVPENLRDLIRKVKAVKADVGLAFDGDADRLGVVDSNGKIYWGDQLMIIFSRDLLSRKKRAKVLVEVKCSSALTDEIRKHGGIPILWKTGHSLIKAKMKEENALLAGEMSGHMFFRENYYGFDDALYAGAKLLGIISSSNIKLSTMLKDVPKYYTSPEIRVDCSDEEKFKVVEELKEYFKKRYKVLTIDGVRVDFGDGWALVRASNTQPALVLRFEAKSKKRLDEIKKVVYARLK